MRPRSLRARLALWYGAAVGLALLAYAAVVLGLVARGLSQELDRQLHDDFELAEQLLEARPDGTIGWRGEPDAHGPAVEVTAPDGAPLYRSLTVIDGAARTLAKPYPVDGRDVVIAVSRPTAPLYRRIGQLALGFLAALPPAVGLALAAGWALAGRALAPVGAMADRARTITAERLEERLPVEDPEDELGQLATAFNALLGRLERSFEALRRFTSDASHELRTPLTAIRTVGEVALREPREAGHYREVLGSVLEETDRLARLVDALLALTRADGGRVAVERRPVDLAALAGETVAGLAILADERGQRIGVQGLPSATVEADPDLLRTALGNLVDNAIRHGREGGTIRVVVGADTVEVVDDGPGIASEHRPRVFERFYRIDPARGREGGAGLGLAIARQCVELQGGTLALESEIGRGSTFRVRLPARG